MKSLKYILPIALCLVILLSACGKKKDNYEPYVPTDADLSFLDHVEIEDMDGYEFRILTRKGDSWRADQYVEEQTGDIISDAVYRRNETVKALFNVDIVSIESSSNYADDAMNNILAGDDQYDIIFPHARTAFRYAVQDAAVNIHDIETIDLSQEWWAQDIVDNCSVNGHLYVLDGDISTNRLYYTYTIFFNKRIFDELGIEYPYSMVMDGEWTFDAFKKLVKLGTKDLNGDGLIMQEYDQYGYSAVDWYGPFSVLYSGGVKIYSKDERGLPKLSLNSAKTTQIFSQYFDLTNSEDVFMQLENERMPTTNLFSSGRAMFADTCLGQAKAYRDMSDEFGILPFPKFSSEDEYTSLIGGGASLLVVPITVSDYNRTGKIIEALCAFGNRDVIPAFYDISLKTKFSRDAESEVMIDTIKDSLTYDLGYLSGGSFQSIGYTLAHQSNPDFASYYASNESKALSDLNTFLKSYAKIS